MGFDKGEVIKTTLVEVGTHLEEQLDAAERLVQQEIGGRNTIQQHCANLLGIVKAADSALNTSDSEDSIPDIKTLALVKLWILKCVRATENLARTKANHVLVAQGAASQIKTTHDWLQKKVTAAEMAVERKAREAQEAIETAKVHPDVITDEDGELVYVGTGTAPAGIRMGNRAQKRAHEAASEAPKKKVTRRRKKINSKGNHANAR